MLRIGLNPYGLAYAVGLQGAGTPRANPSPVGLEGFLALARETQAACVEVHAPWLDGAPAARARVRDACTALGATAVLSTGLTHEPGETLETAIAHARAVGSSLIRLGLTPVLEGSRDRWGSRWHVLVAHARETLGREAPRAADAGVTIAIEDHQDFGSEELVEMAESAGPNVGIVFDTGNPFAVGEDPVAFARRAAHRIRHVHLKDYVAQFTDEGYRLIRCAIGEGAVPFAELRGVLQAAQPVLTASIEPGALEARHIRLFTPDWWNGYPRRAAAELAAAIGRLRQGRLPEGDPSTTPWERHASPEEIVAYELNQVRRSVQRMTAFAWEQP
ncbi:MAG TPA: sugar phosphate isomerase/epimerase family protein [Vicinamibacterales bacterium]|jgi:sugar phosphate isomerase/epimerase